jgi:cytochrome P450
MSTVARSPVRQFTMLAGPQPEDPFEVYSRLGNVEPFWTDNPNDVDGFWVVTRYADVRTVLQDSDSFSSLEAFIPLIAMGKPMLPTESDPPDTRKYRSILLPEMTPAKIDPLEPRMHAVCAEIIESFIHRGHCDVVADFAREYPIRIFIEFFGLPPERREEFRGHAHTFLHSPSQRLTEWAAIRAIVEEQLQNKRSNPQDDLLSAIAKGLIDGELIDLETATNVASTVFLGGLDTLPSNIGWAIGHLARYEDMRRRIVEDPELIPQAVEEFLRYYPVANPVRRAIRDVDLGGSRILGGDRLFLIVGRANRDVEEFTDAAAVVYEREANRHLAFGAGAHRCLGSHLARHELVVALTEWHARIPHYRIPTGADVTYNGGVLAMGKLPLEWDAPTAS